jgi:bifunctional DNase/RNase
MTQVECSVKGVFVAVNDSSSVPLVILTDGKDRILPVFVGLWEAVSINSAKNKELLPRPFTHELFLDFLSRFSLNLRSLSIDSITDGIFYARIQVTSGQREERIDCRPSDGIALALRGNAPIYVDETVLDLAGQKISDLPKIVELSVFMQT